MLIVKTLENLHISIKLNNKEFKLKKHYLGKDAENS